LPKSKNLIKHPTPPTSFFGFRVSRGRRAKRKKKKLGSYIYKKLFPKNTHTTISKVNAAKKLKIVGPHQLVKKGNVI